MKKVIITGGMGFIGSHTAVELINHGFEAIIVDNLSNSDIKMLSGIEKTVGQSVQYEEIDLTNEPATTALIEKHKDAVGIIHFAAWKSVSESLERPTDYYRNNIFSLVNIHRKFSY